MSLQLTIGGQHCLPDDAARARQELGALMACGMKVTVWSHAGFADLSRYFARLLDSLGYHARVRVLGDNRQPGFDKATTSATRPGESS